MRLRSLRIRRPSAPLLISSAALFLSLGGVGYAAVTIPDNSVGTAQIKNNAVSFRKVAPNSIGQVRLANGGVTNAKLAKNSVSYQNIQAGTVGTVRANLNELQARLKSSCAATTAVGGVDNKGNVTCNSTLPAETSVAQSTTPTPITSTAAPVATVSLAAGANYLAFADPVLTVTSRAAAQTVALSCTLTVGATTQTRNVTLTTDGTAGDTASRNLNLQAAGASGTSTVSCTGTLASGSTGTVPVITAVSPIDAIATAVPAS